MAAKLSTEITDRAKSCLFVLSALEQQGPRVADEVLGLVRPTLWEGDEPPNFFAQTVAFSRALKARLDRMVVLDLDHYGRKQNRKVVTRQRVEKSRELGDLIRGLRRSITGQYTAPELERLGLKPPVSRDPMTLLLQPSKAWMGAAGEGLALFDLPQKGEGRCLSGGLGNLGGGFRGN